MAPGRHRDDVARHLPTPQEMSMRPASQVRRFRDLTAFVLVQHEDSQYEILNRDPLTRLWQLVLSDYRQALEINNRVVEETVMRNDSNKLSPAMQGYYWERVKELSHLRAKHPHFRSRYD